MIHLPVYTFAFQYFFLVAFYIFVIPYSLFQCHTLKSETVLPDAPQLTQIQNLSTLNQRDEKLHCYIQQDNRGCISPAPTLDLVTRGAAPGHTGSYSSFFLYKLFKMYFFCEIEKVSRCLKCNVFLIKLKTKSHKTTKRKHVIISITIEGFPEKLKL